MAHIRVQNSTQKNLKKLAKAENRTMGGEIAFLVDERCKAIGILPVHPPSVKRKNNNNSPF
jgi:hypothetical protein